MNYFSHLIRFLLNSWLRSSSEIQNNCGWLVSWWQNSGSLRGADLGEGVHDSMRARRLGKELGTGGKRQHWCSPLYCILNSWPQHLPRGTSDFSKKVSLVGVHSGRSFPSALCIHLLPFYTYSIFKSNYSRLYLITSENRGLTFNAFQNYRVLGNRDHLSNLCTGHQIRLAEI